MVDDFRLRPKQDGNRTWSLEILLRKSERKEKGPDQEKWHCTTNV